MFFIPIYLNYSLTYTYLNGVLSDCDSTKLPKKHYERLLCHLEDPLSMEVPENAIREFNPVPISKV